MRFIFLITAAASSFLLSNACLAGPAVHAIESYHGGKIEGDVAPSASLFDMAQVGPAILGLDVWSTLEARQRQEYEQLMQKLLVANYTKRMRKVSEWHFKEETIAGGEATVVATGIDDLKFETINVYKLSTKSGSWRLIDVIVDGVSGILSHRGQQRNIVRSSGFDALLQKIRERLSRPPS